MNFKSYKLQNGPFARQRSLIIAPDYIEFENGNSRGPQFERFSKSEIVDIKYGNHYIKYGTHILGRKYSISLKNRDGRILDVKFKTYFNIDGEYLNWYSEIVTALQQYYLNDIVDEYFKRFYENGEVTVGRIKLDKKGINVIGTGLDFEWTDLKVTEHSHCFELSKPRAPEFHIRIMYNEWFAELLYRLVITIKKEAETKTAQYA